MNAMDLSLIVIVVGVRGSGKTLLMTHFGLETLRDAWIVKRAREFYGYKKYPRRKVNAWSNYPYKALWKPGNVLLQPETLDIDKLITWRPEFHDGVIFFDEIDQVADRQDWQGTLSKLLNAGVQVLRHRNLSMIVSVQSLNWLNARLQWQADIIVKCRDLAFTPWGRDKHLQPGEVMQTTWIDKSGILTGSSYEESFKTYPMQFFGKRYWNAYSTQHEFDIMEYKTKYRLKANVREISQFNDAEIEAQLQEQDTMLNNVVYSTLMQFVYNGQDKLPLSEIQKQVKSVGINIKRAQLIDHLEEMHNVTHYVKNGYPWLNLENITNLAQG